MSYRATGNLPGGFPGFPGMLPGPIAPHPGAPGPTVPANIFPTHTRVGDVVNVTGPFGGFGQGQVRVRFQGTSWLYPQIMGPTMASVVVPEGAQNGLCEIEINGRRVFGTNCIVDQGEVRVGRPSHAGRDTRSWTERGERISGLGGPMYKKQPPPLTAQPLAGYLGPMPAGVVQTSLIISGLAYVVRAGNEQFMKKGQLRDDIKTYSSWAHWGFLALAFAGAFGVIHE